MNKHHFIVSLALVSVLMVGSLGLASCVPRGKDYNSSISNTRALLNPDEVAKLDVPGIANLIDKVLAGFSEDEKDEFFRDELLRGKDYNSSISNTQTEVNPDDLVKLDVPGLANLIDKVLAGFSEDEKNDFFRDEFIRTGNYNSSLSNKWTLAISTPNELADFVVDELNKFSEAELMEFFTDELSGCSADLNRN